MPHGAARARSVGLRVLTGILERVRGLKGRGCGASCVVLVPCRDIHTFGMKGSIDVAFVDEKGIVVAVHRGVAPGRRIRCAEARMVFERPARPGAWLECGNGVFAPGVFGRNVGKEGGEGDEDLSCM